MLSTGQLDAHTEVWREGMATWRPACELAELAEAIPLPIEEAEVYELLEGNWWFAQSGRKFGPVPARRLRALARSGRLSSNDLVWREGLPKWVPVERVAGLFGSTAAGPPPLPPEDADIPDVLPVDSRASDDAVLSPQGWQQFDADFRRLYERGDWQGMVRYMSEALTQNGEHYLFYHARGLALGQLGDLERAIADVSRAVELLPTWASGYYLRGVYYYRLAGLHDSSLFQERSMQFARQDMADAVRLAPDNAEYVRFQQALYARPARHGKQPAPSVAAPGVGERAKTAAANTAARLLGQLLFRFFEK